MSLDTRTAVAGVSGRTGNPLRARLDALRREGRTAMGLFLTSGFPDPASTPGILDAMVRGGADFVELGMPFSDPLAEGIPIQKASTRALLHGTTMRTTFDTAEAFSRRHPDVPLVLMGYVNPVWQYGLTAFCRDAAAAGVAGLILPDLPPEEADAFTAEADASGLGLTFLVAPNTSPARVQAIDARSTGFVYAVSTPGLTGQALQDHSGVEAYLARTRAIVTQNPLLVGFGIRTRHDAARLSAFTDGFIVGSALIEHVERLWDDVSLSTGQRLAAVEAFVAALRPQLL